VRVVLVLSEGPAFSSGLDRRQLSLLGELGRDPHAAERIAEFQEAFTWLSSPDLVSIAGVQGHAIGAGFQLALACDLRVATDATVFAMPETTLGLVPDMTGTHPLVRAVGYPRALEWCLTGRQVTAIEALATGLVAKVVHPDELGSAVQELATAVLASPRDAVIETKALLQGVWQRSPAQQWEAERQAQARVLRDRPGE